MKFKKYHAITKANIKISEEETAARHHLTVSKNIGNEKTKTKKRGGIAYYLSLIFYIIASLLNVLKFSRNFICTVILTNCTLTSFIFKKNHN